MATFGVDSILKGKEGLKSAEIDFIFTPFQLPHNLHYPFEGPVPQIVVSIDMPRNSVIFLAFSMSYSIILVLYRRSKHY